MHMNIKAAGIKEFLICPDAFVWDRLRHGEMIAQQSCNHAITLI